MAKVFTHMTMSLDGYIAQPDDQPAELFDWYWGGDVSVPSAQEGMTFEVDEAERGDVARADRERGRARRRPPPVRRRRRLERQPSGRVTGRRGHPQPPGGRGRAVAASTTFVDGVAAAIDKAREIAGDKDVTIMSADIVQQALDLGLVDEICVSLAPVLFGEGIRYFGTLDGGHLLLEDPVVVQGRRAVHLRYPVRR